jgi:hypothetical protein
MLGLWGDVELSGWGSLEESWSFIVGILILGMLDESADVGIKYNQTRHRPQTEFTDNLLCYCFSLAAEFCWSEFCRE